MKKYKLFAMLNAFAMVLAVQSITMTCLWVAHQPKVPQELAKFKK
ncbi:MAG: cyclic lactone autoinducer peptide [Lachnospiraceae bacterium]